VLALAVSTAAAGAEEPWDAAPFSAPPDAVVAAVAELPSPDAAVEILLAELEWELDAEGVVSSREHQVYRILEQGGIEEWSSIETWWSPWYQERPEIRARVILPDGSERRLDPELVTESAAPGDRADLYEDTRLLRAPLPAVKVGAVVEIEVRQQRVRPYFAAGETRRRLLSDYTPVRRSRVILDLPAGLEVYLRTEQLGEPERHLKNGRERLVFEAADLPSLEDREPWLPPEDRQLGPWIGWATGPSWAAVAAAYAEIVEVAIADADIGDLIDGLGEPGDDRNGWLAQLLTRLHRRVRYTGVEFGDAKIVPRTPAETLARGFGDCKDKATLLVAALRRAGIPAHVALLKSGFYRSRVAPELPGLGQFNHAIVYVAGEPPMWIDATDPFSRPGELAHADRGRLALVIAPGTTGLTQIPEATAADNRVSVVHEVYLAEAGSGRVVETGELHGVLAATERSFYHGESRDLLEDWFETQVEQRWMGGELVSFEITEADDLSQPTRRRLEATDLELVVTDTDDAGVGLRLSGLFQHLPTVLFEPGDEPRENVFAVASPYRAEWIYRIHLPLGLVPRRLPEDSEDAVGPGRFSRRFELSEDGRRVDVWASFELDRRRLEPDEFTAIAEGLDRIEEEEQNYVPILFDHTVNAHLAAGRLGEAIAEARRAARRGTELEPEEAAAWITLAQMLVRDEVGRPFYPGYDRDGAIAALRKAAELDAENDRIRGELAVALEHNEQGQRWGESADLEAAITLYREISDRLQELGIVTNLPVALFKAGHYEEMREASERLPDEATRNQFVLTAVAMIDGPEAAVREAERRYPRGEPRASALVNASQDFLLLRRYSDAAELLRVAARQSPNAAALLASAEVLADAVPYERLTDDETDPKSVLVHFLAVLMEAGGETSEEELFRLFASSIRAQTEPEEITEMLAILLPTFRARLGDTPPEVAVDLAAAALSVSLQGDDDLGYRARFQGVLGDQHLDLVMLMVREEGALRLVAALDQDASPVGLEALGRIAAGDLAGARQWLDWALDRDWTAGRVADPFSAEAFPHFWSEEAPDDPEVMRLAAAVLAARLGPESAIETLEAARDGESGLQQARIEEALLQAYSTTEDAEGVHEVVERLRRRIVDESQMLFLQAVAALEVVDRLQELRSLADERLAATPDDPWALRMLAHLDMQEGDVARAAELYERLFATGSELPVDFNNAAWLGLASPEPPTERHLELARRAVGVEDNEASLHTLAALLAAAGRPAEARRVLLQSIETGNEPPDGADLYVLGLLAEAYGLPEAAELYYRRTVEESPEEERENATSPLSLARARLDSLQAAADEL